MIEGIFGLLILIGLVAVVCGYGDKPKQQEFKRVELRHAKRRNDIERRNDAILKRLHARRSRES